MFTTLLRTGLVAVTAALGTLLLSAPAHAYGPMPYAGWGEGDVAWAACQWDKFTKQNIQVSRSYYPDKTKEAPDTKAPQSWDVMIRQAVEQWDSQTENITLNNLNLTYVGERTDGNPNDANLPTPIYFQHTEQVEGGNLGYTYVYTKSVSGRTGNSNGKGNCLIQAYGWDWQPTKKIVKALIRTEDEEYFFTQYGKTSTGLDARKYWENCTSHTTYTCKKYYDGGALMTHELGHALGIMHPNEPVPGWSPSIADNGNCQRQRRGDKDEVATMCIPLLAYRSDQRTIANWDSYAFRYAWAFAFQYQD